MVLSNPSDSAREARLARVIIHGGVIDPNGKFVEVGDPLSQRPLGSGSKS